MKLFFTILLWAIGLQGLMFLSSCDRPAPPQYDEKKAQFLSEVSILLQKQQYEQALARLQTAEPELKTGLLQDMLSSYVQERELLQQANTALLNGQYDELGRLIEQAEKKGEASPELLEFRSAPQALQALQVFCSRMPWESPEDLEHSMNWLRPYLPVLEKASAFREFWQQQLQQRERLQKRQFALKQASLMQQIDRQLAGNQRVAVWNLLETLWQLNPGHPLFSCLDHRQRTLLPDFFRGDASSGTTPEVLELAIALAYPQLNPPQRRAVTAVFPAPDGAFPVTLSGLILAAELQDSLELYAEAWQRWAAWPENRGKFPFFLEKILSEMFSRPEQFNARCWRTPCPNVTDFFARINQIAVNLNQQEQRKKP